MASSGGARQRGGFDLAALNAADLLLDASEPARGSAHVAQLQAVLAVHQVHRRAGLELTTVPYVASRLRCSEHRASELLTDATLMADLPGAFALLEAGVLTVEQSRALCRVLVELDDVTQLELWERTARQLQDDLEQGVVRPPARLTTLLRTWVVEIDAAAAERRRRQAEADGRIEYRRRSDGLVDVHLLGLTGPLAQAVLQRVQAASTPVGHSDDRSADKRRLDAAVDLLLGRTRGVGDRLDSGCDGRPGCGCTVGSPVPCGTDVQVLIPIGAALGTTDQVAQLTGHGPVEPDLTDAVLQHAPRLWPVWIDEHGVPVAVADRPVQAPRGDRPAVRRALLDLAALPPPDPQPRHPHDHPARHDQPGQNDDEQVLADAALGRAPTSTSTGHGHPPGTPGPYRVPARLRRLLAVRRPLCEFPGCGARASRCDLDHDLGWPDGPTCPCNLGPLCRRHHRVKQQGWTKTRTPTGVDWTAPSGHTWYSPSPHQPPAPATREPSRLPHPPDDFDQLSPLDQQAELQHPSTYDDPHAYDLRAVDREPTDEDVTARRILGDTRWTLDLHDPYAWT